MTKNVLVEVKKGAVQAHKLRYCTNKGGKERFYISPTNYGIDRHIITLFLNSIDERRRKLLLAWIQVTLLFFEHRPTSMTKN